MADNVKNLVKVKPSELTVSNPLGINPVYSNNAGVTFTPWDVRFIFSEIVAADPRSAYIEQRANIAMNPAHAKALLAVLTNALKVYEERHGSIPDPQLNVPEVALRERKK